MVGPVSVRDEAAEAALQALCVCNIHYFFPNPGTDFLAILESYKGVAVVGLLPTALQMSCGQRHLYSGLQSIARGGVAVVRFLTDPDNAARWKQATFEPSGVL